MEIEKLVRPNIVEFSAYTVKRDDYLEDEQFVFLDNCENNLGSPIGLGYERYPTSNHLAIRQKIAGLEKLNPKNIVLGNGSDELIDLIIRCFCEPGVDEILINEPTFGMFRVYAKLNNVKVNSAALVKETFEYNIEGMISKLTPSTKCVFICSPNNPTGTIIQESALIKLLDTFKGIVILDEAYVDFSSTGSMTRLINNYKHLIVLKTFSKAWGLAKLRCGYAIASEAIISYLFKIKPPFNVNGLAQDLLIKALTDVKLKDKYVGIILEEKQRILNELKKYSFVVSVLSGHSNFLFIKVKDADKLCSYLLHTKILISNRGSLLNCTNYVRISIGNIEENNRLIDALNNFKS